MGTLARQDWAVAPACPLAQNGLVSGVVGVTVRLVAPMPVARQEAQSRQ